MDRDRNRVPGWRCRIAENTGCALRVVMLSAASTDPQQTRRMPLQELKNRLRYPRFDVRFSGRVEAGKQYRKPLADVLK